MVDTPSIPPSYTPPAGARVNPMSTGLQGVGTQSTQVPITIPQGSTLSGNVTAIDAKGNVTIETSAVKMVLQASVPLPQNAQVSVRIELPIGQSQMPSVRILTVDGKPFSQFVQQQQNQQHDALLQNVVQNMTQTVGAAKIAEIAKPIAQLLEIVARPALTQAAKAATDTPQTSSVGGARSVAAQLDIPATQTLPAVLIRPVVTPKTPEILANLIPAAAAPVSKGVEQPSMPVTGMDAAPVAPNPPLTVEMLKPGLQLQVRIVTVAPTSAEQTGITAPQQAAVSTSAVQQKPEVNPPSAAVSPAVILGKMTVQDVSIPANPAPASNIPAQAKLAPTFAELLPVPEEPHSPLPTELRAGYAVYARQTPAPMPGVPATPVPSAQEAVLQKTIPQGASAAPVSPQLPQTDALPVDAKSSAAPSVQIPVPGEPLSATVVNQLLTAAEGKGLPPSHMAGVVIGKEQHGGLIVQTRLGLFSVPAAIAESAQPGTVITWQVKQAVPLSIQASPLDPATGVLADAVQFGREGSALQDIADVLQAVQNPAIFQAFKNIIPHAGPNLTAGMLLFMSVIKKGDVGTWLGKDLSERLEALGKGDLLQRLGGEITAMRSLLGNDQTQPGSGWQAMFLPVMVEQKMETAHLFVKPDEAGKKGGGNGTRFVVELDLSAFGTMQFDGMVKKRDNQTYFNLAIRTHSELPAAVKTDIYAIFDNAQKVTGMAGGISFKTMAEFPVNPLEEIRASKASHDGSILA